MNIDKININVPQNVMFQDYIHKLEWTMINLITISCIFTFKYHCCICCAFNSEIIHQFNTLFLIITLFICVFQHEENRIWMVPICGWISSKCAVIRLHNNINMWRISCDKISDKEVCIFSFRLTEQGRINFNVAFHRQKVWAGIFCIQYYSYFC